MIDFFKKNIFIVIIFLTTLFLGFLTFLTFIFIEISNYLKNDINIDGSVTNRKYIIFFSFFTLVPSILISIFSLFIFSFALEKYLDKKITTAVNNSHEIAKQYVNEAKNKIESDIVLIAYDLEKNINIFYDNPKKFINIIKAQKLIRNVDEIHLINSSGNLITTTLNDTKLYDPPTTKGLEMVFNDTRPLKIINAFVI